MLTEVYQSQSQLANGLTWGFADDDRLRLFHYRPTLMIQPGNLLNSFNDNPFHQYLGLEIEEHRTDFVRLKLHKTATTPTGIGGSVNGGVIATMVDMAAVTAVFTNLRESDQPAGTADIQVTYLRQAQGDVIYADATVIKRGRQLCSVEVSIINDADVLCARGRVLYALRA